MKEGWEIKKLTDICSIQYGCAFDSSLFSVSPEDGMPLIRIRDVKDGCTSTYYKGAFSDEYIIHKGDYLIGMDGEFNIEPWKSDNALLNQRVCKIDSKNKDIAIRYIYRFLKKELKRIEDETPFVTVKHLSAKRLNQVFLSVPSIAEQEKIVAELDCLSGIIEKKKQQLKEYDALAQSIFYEMFGDPVENEKGWIKEEFQSVFKVTSSKRILQSEWQDNGVPFYRVSDIVNLINGYELEPSTFIKETTYNDLCNANLVPVTGDILITSRGTLGQCYIKKENDKFYFQDGMITWLSPKTGNISPVFIKGIFSFVSFLESLLRIANSSTVAYISIKQLSKMLIPLPPFALQQEFASKIEAIEKQKALIKKSIEEVETLFNSRMDYYFN